eukprot:4936580-Pyramimonas_sp.AAC.1
MLDPLELPQARYSALCCGRLVKALLSERGWMGMVQEDLGMLRIHAVGPAGHAYKCSNLYMGSTCIMHKKKGAKAEDFKRYPGHGVDE